MIDEEVIDTGTGIGKVVHLGENIWVKVTSRGLEVLRDPTFNEWQTFVYPYAMVRDAIPFIIGDWVRVGEECFHERFSQALNIFGEYEYNTIANYASTMRRVPASIRSGKLSYTHHALVAKLYPDTELQKKWLKRAELDQALKRGLTSGELRMLLSPTNSREPSFVTRINKLILVADELRVYAADEHHKDLEDVLATLRRIRAECKR